MRQKYGNEKRFKMHSLNSTKLKVWFQPAISHGNAVSPCLNHLRSFGVMYSPYSGIATSLFIEILQDSVENLTFLLYSQSFIGNTLSNFLALPWERSSQKTLCERDKMVSTYLEKWE